MVGKFGYRVIIALAMESLLFATPLVAQGFLYDITISNNTVFERVKVRATSESVLLIEVSEQMKMLPINSITTVREIKSSSAPSYATTGSAIGAGVGLAAFIFRKRENSDDVLSNDPFLILIAGIAATFTGAACGTVIGFVVGLIDDLLTDDTVYDLSEMTLQEKKATLEQFIVRE